MAAGCDVRRDGNARRDSRATQGAIAGQSDGLMAAASQDEVTALENGGDFVGQGGGAGQGSTRVRLASRSAGRAGSFS